MTWDQYWYGDVWMVELFRKKNELEQKQKDLNAWLNGVYVLHALQATVGNIGREGKEPIRYPDEPIYMSASSEKTEEQKRKAVENERLRAYAQFDLLIRQNKARRGEA